MIVSTLCLLYAALPGLFFVLTTGFSFDETLLSLVPILAALSVAMCVSLALRQWFKSYPKLTIMTMLISMLLTCEMYGLSSFWADELLKGMPTNTEGLDYYRVEFSLVNFLISLVFVFALFIIPIWVNWPVKSKPINEAFV